MPTRRPFPFLYEAFIIVLMLFFTEYLVDALIWNFGRDAGLQKIEIDSIGRVLACGLVFPVLMHYGRYTYRELVHDNLHSWTYTILSFALPVLLLIPGLVLVEIMIERLVLVFFPMTQSMADAMQTMIGSGLGSVLLVCFIAPVVEEMLFRGIILRGFLRQYTPGVAVVHSAAVFGLAHLNVYQFFGGFTIGVLLGAVYQRTRSLLPCILIHMSYNTAGVLLANRSGPETWGDPISLPLSWHMPAAICGCIGAWLLVRIVAAYRIA
ncbi:membrane protease YdiL (CAAX protease family) [Paraburkholderia sp. JPY465]|uniref:CPBP family intramembrane glutamic endopeptidase n=1 Tax=Paraburkholderia sp. JPY465 TaxID=3042285 RepID=UPI003D1C5BCF